MDDFRPIPGYEGYFVSCRGEIRGPSGKLLKPIIDDDEKPYGYILVTRKKRNPPPRRRLGVHQAVALAFIGPCPAGELVRHLDGDPRNNAADNLAYGTPLKNTDDRYRHGRVPNSRRVAALTASDLRRAAKAMSKNSMRAVARKLGVAHTTLLRRLRSKAKV